MQLDLPPEYLHSTETRSQNQINLTNKIVKVLTQLNLKRTMKTPPNYQSNFLFICLCGLPPFDNQFQNLDLPGQVIVKPLTGCDKVYSDEEYIEMWKEVGMREQAEKIHKIVEEKGKNKDLVFVYHSFGSFIVSIYLSIYKSTKIKGLMDLGGAPTIVYPLIKNFFSYIHDKTDEEFIDNPDKIYQQSLDIFEKWKKKNIILIPFKNKYQTIFFFKCLKSKEFQSVFDFNRKLPDVLKLICFGSRDYIFEEEKLSEKPIHYCYRKRLDKKYEAKLLKKYQQFFGQKVNNIQERFVYNFQGAHHSFHMQKRFNAQLKEVIRQYLSIIDVKVEEK